MAADGDRSSLDGGGGGGGGPSSSVDRSVGRTEEGGGHLRRRRPSAIVDIMRQGTPMVTGWVDVRGYSAPRSPPNATEFLRI